MPKENTVTIHSKTAQNVLKSLGKPDQTIGDISFHELPPGLQSGAVFSKASLGFLGEITYSENKHLRVETKITNPVFATLSLQLAGWKIGNAMISGPVRLAAQKPPGFPYGGKYGGETTVACAEGKPWPEKIAQAFLENGIKKAIVLSMRNENPGQKINIAARAVEIVTLRLHYLKADYSAEKAESVVEILPCENDIACHANDAIRFKGKVKMWGDFGKIGDEEAKCLTTSCSGKKQKTFRQLLDEAKGDLHMLGLDSFTVQKLVLIDSETLEEKTYE